MMFCLNNFRGVQTTVNGLVKKKKFVKTLNYSQ